MTRRSLVSFVASASLAGVMLASAPPPAVGLVIGADTATTISSNHNPSVVGQSVTFTATVMTDPPGGAVPTGTVQFERSSPPFLPYGDQVPLNLSGLASLEQPNGLSPGCDTFRAVYVPADTNFIASTSAELTQCVNAAATTTSLTSDHNPSAPGQAVTFSATVTAHPPGGGTPDGDVQFSIDGVNQGAAVTLVGGKAVLLAAGLAPGEHLVTAAYGGHGGIYETSTSSTLTQQVEPDTTITTGPSEWTNHNTPAFEFHADTPSATFECSMDSGPLAPCTSPYHSAALADGSHNLFVRAVVGSVPDGDAPNWSFFVDTTAPYTGYAEVEQQLGGQVSSGPIEIYWQATDNLIKPQQLHHEWQWRKKVSGVWQAWQAGGSVDELEATFSQPFLKLYQYRIRSVDLAGNWSVWEETDPVKLLAKQETAFTYSASWVRHTMSGAWANYVRTRAKVGAWARLAFTGTGVALVMPTGAGQGTISVCLDPGTAGQQCSTINLATFSPTGVRRLVAVFGDLVLGKHAIKVTVVSGTVNLDGAIVRQ